MGLHTSTYSTIWKRGVCFCLLSAPDKEAVIKHHDKVNIECEWITEVSMATGNESLKFTTK